MDASLAQHGDDQLAHGVLDLLRGEHADAVGGLIDVKRDARDAVEGAPVVLGLEAEVALDEDGDAGGLAADVLADVADVGGDERELFGGIYRKKM